MNFENVDHCRGNIWIRWAIIRNWLFFTNIGNILEYQQLAGEYVDVPSWRPFFFFGTSCHYREYLGYADIVYLLFAVIVGRS